MSGEVSEPQACGRCPVLEQQLDQAEREAEEQRERAEELGQILGAILAYCVDVENRARPILSRSSGVPRGTWSLVKGRSEVAGAIADQLAGR